jgi:hypothetical protein
MGGPCDILVPAALLYRNSKGLDFDEFYNNIKEISNNIGSGDIDWGRRNKYIFASQILNFTKKREFKEFEKSNYNSEFGYFRERFIYLDELEIRKKKHTLLEDKFVFDVDTSFIPNHHEGYSFGDYLEHNKQFFCAKGIPDKYRDPSIKIRINSVIKKEEPVLIDYENWTIKQKLEGIPIKFDISGEIFSNENELVKKYPEYSLENVFDFSLGKGFLYPSTEKGTKAGLGYRGGCPFVWNKKGKKYVLDENHMLDNLSPNSVYANDSRRHWSAYSHIDYTEEWRHEGNRGVFSFTDLIITNEAIKKQNWKLLRYTGNRSELLKFLYNNPGVFAAYEKAVLDIEFSLEAKKQGLTNFEFLRDYHNKMANRKQLDLNVARKELEKYRNNKLEKKIKHIEKVNKELRKQENNELHF